MTPQVQTFLNEEDKRRAILLNVRTYRLLKTLASPKKVDEFKLTQLVELATTHVLQPEAITYCETLYMNSTAGVKVKASP